MQLDRQKLPFCLNLRSHKGDTGLVISARARSNSCCKTSTLCFGARDSYFFVILHSKQVLFHYKTQNVQTYSKTHPYAFHFFPSEAKRALRPMLAWANVFSGKRACRTRSASR